jgi:hypothetical protein
MSDSDDMGRQPRSGSDLRREGSGAEEAKDSGQARSAGKSSGDARQRVAEIAGAAKDSAASYAEAGRDLVRSRTSDAYRNAAGYARSGYETASQQVAASPMTALLLAVGVGIGIGWLIRGAVEEEHRRTWIDALMERGARWRR